MMNYTYVYELQPKSSFNWELYSRHFFLELSWGLENDHTLLKKNKNMCLYTKTRKTIDTLFKNWWLGAIYQILTVAHMAHMFTTKNAKWEGHLIQVIQPGVTAAKLMIWIRLTNKWSLESLPLKWHLQVNRYDIHSPLPINHTGFLSFDDSRINQS